MPLTQLQPSPMPSYYVLQNLLQGVFHWQARQVAMALNLDAIEAGDFPDTDHLAVRAAQAVQPLVLQSFRHGYLRSHRRVQSLVRYGRPMADDMRQHVLPSQHVFGKQAKGWDGANLYAGWIGRNKQNGVRPSLVGTPASFVSNQRLVTKRQPWEVEPVPYTSTTIAPHFNLFNPRVLEAVDKLTLHFCEETNATATDRLHVSLEALRKLLKRGLERGDAVAFLARKVTEIFADPSRAFRIAATESSRAMHAGSYMAAEENDAVKGTQWLASSDACDRCLKLDGKYRRFGVPFWVNPKGGPYARVMHPPLHPHCFCDISEVLA